MADISLKEAEKFYKKGLAPADAVIKADLKKDDSIVHGSRAVNAQVLKYLQRPTQDWDIFSRNPQTDAQRIEGELDKEYGGNYFIVTPAKHEGTVKIICRVRGKTVVDLTAPKHQVPAIIKNEIRYGTLGYMIRRAKEIMKDPESKHRHEQDAEMVQRIEIQFRKAGIDGLVKTLKQDGYAAKKLSATTVFINKELDKNDKGDIRELCKAFGYSVVSIQSRDEGVTVKLKKR